MASIGAATADDDGSKFVGTRRPIALQAMDDRFQWRINDRSTPIDPLRQLTVHESGQRMKLAPGKKGGSVSRMR
jgi:hypothetical protein